MRIKLLIAYDGAPFAGWQSQANGNAVQDHLETALAKIAEGRVVVHGSGRTDAGVHALAQCAHADVPDTLAPPDWLRALNANLPPAIRVLRAARARADFHARFSARGKIYRYVIHTGAVLPPLDLGRCWHVPQLLDDALLARAARLFTGRHDFAAFSASRGKEEADTRRTLRHVRVSRRGPQISLTFEGEGFLYKMARMLTAAIVRCAQGRETPEALQERLREGAPRWNHVAPAEGLYLVRVLY